MAARTLEGVVENGQIRLSDDIALAEHARVYVVIPDPEPGQELHIYSPHLAHPEQASDFVMEIFEEPSDADL